MPNYDMGFAETISNRKFEEAAKAVEQSPEEAKKNAREMLERVLASKEQSTDKEWKP